MPTFGERIKRSWNAFRGQDDSFMFVDTGPGSGYRPDRIRMNRNNARSMVTSIYNRIAVDVASIDMHHVRLDEDDNFLEIIKDPLNTVLSLDANIDQTGPALIQDIVMSMFDEGVVAVVPIDTIGDPEQSDSYDIYSLRTGKIKEWFPGSVRVEVYNERTGLKEEILMPKRLVAIIENPFYSIMNEPNSVLQRLLRLLAQVDRTNDQNSSGKLDLIVQLPYTVKSEARRIQANNRRKDLADQLAGSKYGIGYIDATERITQLNRAVENNFWQQAKDLMDQLHNELGLTQNVFDGTAKEEELLNYYTRTVEPIMAAICTEMERKWLTKTARTQRQGIRYIRDPFKLVPVNGIADIADKFTRNEILSSNELRAIIGRKPSSDPKASQLINSNLNQSKEEVQQTYGLADGTPQRDSQTSTQSDSRKTSTTFQNGQNWLNHIGNQGGLSTNVKTLS